MRQFTPRKYQRVGIKWLVQNPEAALLWDPGLGKTAVALKAFQAIAKAGGGKKALVLAPKKVCYNVWSEALGSELTEWEDFSGLRSVILHGPHKDDLLEEDADIYVINYDGIPWLVRDRRFQSLFKRGVDVLIADELSKLKHTQTKRFKLLKPYLGKFKRRWGLTGSPASNSLMDVFGQAYTIDLGRSLGPFITYYRNQYFVPCGYQLKEWRLAQGAEDRIYKAISPWALSMRAEDHLDLPQLVEQNLWVALPAKARKIYTEFEDDLIAMIDDKTITAANAAVASGKCRQVASGGVYRDIPGTHNKREVLHIHNEKTEVLEELVDELQGQQLLIAYEFAHDLERIRKALGKDVPALNGQTTDKKAAEIIAGWNSGAIRILCGHPAAMGHGLNLQKSSCSHVVWYSLTWNQELYDQTIRRVYRQGTNARRVIIHRILARDTIDAVVAAALETKKRTQDALFEALKDLRKRRKRRAA